jgi:hypothetical protein
VIPVSVNAGHFRKSLLNPVVTFRELDILPFRIVRLFRQFGFQHPLKFLGIIVSLSVGTFPRSALDRIPSSQLSASRHFHIVGHSRRFAFQLLFESSPTDAFPNAIAFRQSHLSVARSFRGLKPLRLLTADQFAQFAFLTVSKSWVSNASLDARIYQRLPFNHIPNFRKLPSPHFPSAPRLAHSAFHRLLK